MGAAGARSAGAAHRGQLRGQASCGDTRAAPPGLAGLGRCTWKDVSEDGLFSFGEVVTDWDTGGTEGETSWPYSML